MVLTNAPRGTQDILPSQSDRWQYVEQAAIDIAALFGFREIRVPTFEHTELFNRSVGDTTDVVQKEMYTFLDKGERSITLRPEGTAGTIRAIIQNGLLNDAMPLKVCYLANCFRYEKPQAGRFREFHQFGVELVGSSSPVSDAVVIALVDEIFRVLGIANVELQINSIGCPVCRPSYHTALRDYFETEKENLCPTCLQRLEKNPMRILDCKSKVCSDVAKDAPVALGYLCKECEDHFDGLKQNLDVMNIPFTVNEKIVRGLDYYTKTVFEFVATNIGAQGTICGGGRYDGLVEYLGGNPTPAIGFGMGLERLLLVMQQNGCEFPHKQTCTIYIGSMGEAAGLKAVELVKNLRSEGFFVECDIVGRSVKAQMKYADKIGAKLSCVIGEAELTSGKIVVKDMKSGETTEIDLTNEGMMEIVYRHNLNVLIDATD